MDRGLIRTGAARAGHGPRFDPGGAASKRDDVRGVSADLGTGGSYPDVCLGRPGGRLGQPPRSFRRPRYGRELPRRMFRTPRGQARPTSAEFPPPSVRTEATQVHVSDAPGAGSAYLRGVSADLGTDGSYPDVCLGRPGGRIDLPPRSSRRPRHGRGLPRRMSRTPRGQARPTLADFPLIQSEALGDR
jgi:hypothetical protein